MYTTVIGQEIKVGLVYKTRFNKKIKIKEIKSKSRYPISDGQFSWSKNGYIYDRHNPHPYDLISFCNENKANKLISYEEESKKWEYLKETFSPVQLDKFIFENIIDHINKATNKDKIENLYKAKFYLDKIINEIQDNRNAINN